MRIEEICNNAALARNEEFRRQNSKEPELKATELMKRINYIHCPSDYDLMRLSKSLLSNIGKSARVFLIHI